MNLMMIDALLLVYIQMINLLLLHPLLSQLHIPVHLLYPRVSHARTDVWFEADDLASSSNGVVAVQRILAIRKALVSNFLHVAVQVANREGLAVTQEFLVQSHHVASLSDWRRKSKLGMQIALAKHLVQVLAHIKVIMRSLVIWFLPHGQTTFWKFVPLLFQS